MDLEREWYNKELQEMEQDRPHRLPQEEYSFYQAVKSGDLTLVRENCRQGAFTNPEGMGILSKNPLTNIKYHFVIATAMITRYCVEGGMETEQAYRLSDFYIMKLDHCNTIKSVADLHQKMCLDFTEKMHSLRKTKIISKHIVLCTDYIYNHINTRITVDTLAEQLGLSPAYLSRLFKKELSISVSAYIRAKKIEKAKQLLRYSDMEYVEIANYLAFSSQSHFIQIFSKQEGMTPRQYRNQFFHSTL